MTPLSKGIMKLLEMRTFKSSSEAPHCLIIDFGVFTNPSSSATMLNVIYKHLAPKGISKKASLKTIDFANILRSAILLSYNSQP
jgi:hypothetical protein